MSKLAWYAGRIAAMSPGEIGWRVRQTLSGAVPIARRYRVRRGARLVPGYEAAWTANVLVVGLP